MALRKTKIEPAAPDKPKPFIVSDELLARARGGNRKAIVQPFTIPEHPPGVAPANASMAMDEGLSTPLSWAANIFAGSMYLGDQHFIGYPELALLAQRPEFRRISETISTEMTRKWIRIQASGDEDKSEKIARIEAAFKRLGVREIFREAAEQDGFFGRGHIYLDLGTTDEPDELKTDIGDGNSKVSKTKVVKGSLKRLKSVEAVWCYPLNYNSYDPLSADWYKPSSWFVNAKEIHSSRFLTFVGREVPDLLKSAYSFGGLSLSQMLRPYIDNWIRTRQSISDLVHSFSVSGLTTNLADALNVGSSGDSLLKRVQLFNDLRDNRGLMVLNKETEEFFNVSTPLGTLDHLQAQSQEHIASIAGIPLVKLLGVTPSGLNASSDGEIRCFYDWIHAYQELLFTANLTKILGFVQLSEFGEVDPDIEFVYEPLWSLDEEKLASVRMTEAQTDQIHIATQVIKPDEARKRVSSDPDTPYAGLHLVEPPETPIELKVEYGAKIATAIEGAYTAGLINHAQGLKELRASSEISGMFESISDEDISEAEAEPPPPSEMEMMQAQAEMKANGPDDGGGGNEESGGPGGAEDAEFNESDHPRDNDGKWTDGGGGSPSSSPEAARVRNSLSDESGSRELNVRQQKALNEYLGGGHSAINQHAENGNGNEITSERVARLKELTGVPTKNEFHVYRGHGGIDTDNFSPGMSFKNKGFTSTSLDPQAASPNSDNDTIFKIHVKPGTKGYYAGGRDRIGGEKEFLLHPGTSFNVIKNSQEDVFKRPHKIIELGIAEQE